MCLEGRGERSGSGHGRIRNTGGQSLEARAAGEESASRTLRGLALPDLNLLLISKECSDPRSVMLSAKEPLVPLPDALGFPRGTGSPERS